MKKLLNLIFILFALQTLRAQQQFVQAPNPCGTAQIGPINPPSGVATCNGYFADYYNTTPNTIYIRVNFWLTAPSVGVGVFANNTINDAQNLITSFNNILANLTPPQLILNPPSIFYPNSKIQFVLNNFQHVVNDNVYNNPISPYGSGTTWGIFADPAAINIIWATRSTGAGYGIARDIPSKEIFMVHDPMPLNQNLGDVGLILHEIGHCMGLWHTGPTTQLNPTGAAPAGSVVNDYWQEDATIWNQNSACGVNPTSHSNNLMGYNWSCRNYLSPQQIGIIHYNASNHPTWAQVVQSAQTTCDSDNSDLNITVNTIWQTGQAPAGNIIIKPGNVLTIAALTRMKKNAKIIVEPGAKLVLTNCAIIESFCNELWEGIEVWGDASQQQYIVNGMPVYQGMVENTGGTIKDAKTGIYVAKKINGNPDLTSTGGIVHSLNAAYINNQIGVDFHPFYKFHYDPLLKGNRSYFKNCSFTFNDNYKGDANNMAYAHIRGNAVYNIRVYGCNFTGNNFYGSYAPSPKQTFGIYGIDSRFVIKDYCQNPSSSTSCNSVPIRNTFEELVSAVYFTNYATVNASVIDHAIFNNSGYYVYGQVFANNIFGLEIINNEFNVKGANYLPTNVYGLYLNNCNGYVVENNLFYNSNGNFWAKISGIYVNNSGPNPNSIYNNTFNYLKQGLWAQNQNYDPISGMGLVMNCNDFLTNSFHIGVQKGGKCFFCPNNTGVAKTQGISGTFNEFDNVRNKYQAISCTSENKFYMSTANSFNITSHGSFLGSQWHLDPYPACSNPAEITDIVGPSQPQNPSKSSYCPAAYNVTYSNKQIGEQLATHRANVTALKAAYTASLDGGNTQTLLNAITGSMSFGQLENLLLSKAFLSDTVLNTYFHNDSIPYGHIKEVFEKNSPVTNKVWQTVSGRSFPAGIASFIQDKQAVNNLSSRAVIESQLQMAQHHVGLLDNELIRRFMDDSTGVQHDSIIAIYNLNELPNSKYDVVSSLIYAGYYDAAKLKLDELMKEPENADYCKVQQYIFDLAKTPNIIEEWEKTGDMKDYLIKEADKGDYLTEGVASSLLAKVYGYHVIEERLEPVEAGGSRLMNAGNENTQQVIKMADGINIYPNPANDVLNVSVLNTESSYDIQVTDLTGKILIKQSCNANCSISLKEMQGGVYLVNLYSNTTLISTKKVVIIK